MVNDDKGGEEFTKIGWEKQRYRVREMIKERDQLKFEHTSKGSKLINLIDVFECAFHIFACMAQVFKFNIHACVVYASCSLDWWNEKLACIEW
jgi:hypothetical protein